MRLLSPVLVLTCATVGFGQSTPGSPDPKPIRAAVQSAIDKGMIGGAVVSVVLDGRPLVFEAFGQADADTKMSTDALFRIASMSKAVTSVAVMMLVEEGAIRLDDPLHRYLPEFADIKVLDPKDGLVAPRRSVTVRDLLTHTSGIAYGLNPPEHLKTHFANARLADGLNSQDPTLEANIKALAAIPLAHQPGTTWTYGMNTDVLGRVIEVTSGQSFDRFLATRIFVPLGMTDTAFHVPARQEHRLVALYTPGKDGKVKPIADDEYTSGITTVSTKRPTREIRYFSGGAGLVSTAADYTRFVQMLLNEGELDGVRLLERDTVREMTRNQIGQLNCAYTFHGDKFGLGFGIGVDPKGTAPVGSYSWGGLYHTLFWVDPHRKLTAVLMTQVWPWGASTLWQDFQKAVYASLLPRSAATPAPAPRDDVPSSLSARTREAIRVSETRLFGEVDCYKIETPAGTYVYGKKGAGFASLLDASGRDWISYAPGDKARGEYRGLPKCGQPTKYFHCGYGYGQYKTDNTFTSTITLQTADRVRIHSEARDGKTACTWEFFPAHATLTIEKLALPTYWFLYEGTPGGKLESDRDFVIRPDGTRTTLDQPWSQVVPWVCFGASESPAGLLCVNHQKPEKSETDSYVSWPFEKGSDGQFHEMTVFGFGRKGYKELIQHVPDLTTLPARFSIALLPTADHVTAKRMAEAIVGAH